MNKAWLKIIIVLISSGIDHGHLFGAQGVAKAAASVVGFTDELANAIYSKFSKQVTPFSEEAIKAASQKAAKEVMGSIGDDTFKAMASVSDDFTTIFQKSIDDIATSVVGRINRSGGIFTASHADKIFANVNIIDDVSKAFQTQAKNLLDDVSSNFRGFSTTQLDDIQKVFQNTLDTSGIGLKAPALDSVLSKQTGFNRVIGGSIGVDDTLSKASATLNEAAENLRYTQLREAIRTTSSGQSLVTNAQTAFDEAKIAFDNALKKSALADDDILKNIKSTSTLEEVSDAFTQVQKRSSQRAMNDVNALWGQYKLVSAQVSTLESKIATGGLTKEVAEELQKDLLALQTKQGTIAGSIQNLGGLPFGTRVGLQLSSLKSLGFKGGLNAVRLKAQTIVSGAFNATLMGFGFAFPGLIQSSIEQSLQTKTFRDTILSPQKFGDIWMQIPKSLISGPGSSVAYFPLYVALARAQTDKVTDRVDDADTETYLLQAPLLVSRDDWANYAKSAIPAGDFPGKMVELRTGAHIIGSGSLVPGNEMIQLFGEGKGQRSEVLSDKMSDFVDEVEGGVKKKEYAVYREQSVKYNGNPQLGVLLDAAQNKAHVRALYPDLPEKFMYPAILNNTVQTVMNGCAFGPYTVKGFQAEPLAVIKQLGGSTAVGRKPYSAMGMHVYQTYDTPAIKTVKLAMARAGQKELASKVCEYVVVLDDSKQPTPLMIPLAKQPYNFPTLVLNPDADYLLSLFDGTLYTKEAGKSQGSAIDIAAFIKNYCPDLEPQIAVMTSFVHNAVKYGPFVINGKTLTIEKEHYDKGLYIYKIEGQLENGQPDYVVATHGLQVAALPTDPDFFVSLVTSRIYDSSLVEYARNAGYPDAPYTVYKQADNKPPLVVLGTANASYGTPVVEGLSAPLETLFQDYDINPNTIPATAIKDKANQVWLAHYLGALQTNDQIKWPLALPSPLQWALSERGPQVVISAGEKPETERIGALLARTIPALKEIIDEAHEQWKAFITTKKVDTASTKSYIWIAETAHPITIKATSIADVRNGTFIYTSAQYPDEFLVFSDDAKTLRNARQFNATNPQRYAISITTGNVYDRDARGAKIAQIKNTSALIDQVERIQNKLTPALKEQINAVRAVQQQLDTQKIVTFGPFTLYLFEQDAERGSYIYADVTDIPDASTADPKLLFGKIKQFFVGIQQETIQASADGKEQASVREAFGKQIGEHTSQILNLVNGLLYDRGGSVEGFYPDYSASIDKGLNVQSGYLEPVIKQLESTWTAESSTPVSLRSEVVRKINELTKARYEALLVQKEQLATVLRQQEALVEPLDGNTLRNLASVPLVPYFRALVPERFMKKVGNSYYMIGYADPLEQQPSKVVTYLDFNAGSKAKDTKRAALYKADGTYISDITGIALDMLRASVGIRLQPNGQQDLDVPLYQTKLSVDSKSLVELQTDAIDKQITTQANIVRTAKTAGEKLAAQAQLQILTALATSSAVADEVKKIFKKPIRFFYNTVLRNYYVSYDDGSGMRYIDLTGGYQYGLEGNPYVERFTVYQPASGNGFLIIGHTDRGLPIALFSSDGISVVRMAAIEENQGTFNSGAEGKQYTFVDPQWGTLTVYYNESNNRYTVYVQQKADKEPKNNGEYTHKGLFYTALTYVRSKKGGGAFAFDSTYAQDVQSQCGVLWNGSAAFSPAVVIYDKKAVAINQSTTIGARAGANSVRVAVQEVVYTPDVKGIVINLMAGDAQHQYVPLYSTINTAQEGDCSFTPEIRNLFNFKRCLAGFNVVVDAYGTKRLVKSFNAASLKPVDAKTRAMILSEVSDSRSYFVKEGLDKLLYESGYDRYVYPISESDKGKDFWQIDMTPGCYIDISTGVLYTPQATANMLFPERGIMRSQLLMLLNILEISVAPVQQAGGKKLFDSLGAPYIDRKTGAIVEGRFGLVYRGKAFLDEELKKIDAEVTFTTAQ